MDKYASVRELNFPSLAASLGIAISSFKRSAEEFVGPCPIHGSKTNKGCFRYHDSGKFHCFSCGAKGRGGIDLTMQLLKIGFKAAVERLGDIQALPAKENSPLSESEASGEVLQPLTKDTWRKFAVPCPWLEARVPSADIRELYGVFCYDNPSRRSAWSGRVMLPIRDVEGHLFGYLGRLVPTCDSKEQPKYLLPKGLAKSRFLFGADVVKAGKFGHVPSRVCYLVESPFCVMKFASMGFPALSAFGWSLSLEQIQLLQSLARGIVYLPDRDKYQEAHSVTARLCQSSWCRFPPLPAGMDDPEEMTKEQILAL